MKRNLFKVKEAEKEKLVLEEEQLKHPFLFFFKKYQKMLVLLSTILGVSILGISIGIAISLVGNTGDFEISYINGGDKIDASQDADDEEAEKELLGNIAITDGVVLITKKFMTENGDIVTYYSDGTSLIITSKGIIKRVVALENGNYAIDENGKINENAIRKIVTSTNNVLDDGTEITYYSDGSAEITKDKTTIFIRNGANIEFDLEAINQIFTQVKPSGVSLSKKTSTTDQGVKFTEFFNGSILVEKNKKKYIVHNPEDLNIEKNNYKFPNYNEATLEKTKNLKDGNTIEYYSDGSAIIITTNNDKILVRKSGDIVIKNDALYEIYPNKVAYAVSTTKSPDGKKTTYYDNAAAVIERTDGTKEYIEDSSQIKYRNNKNIISVPSDKKEQIIQKKLPDGTVVTNFENGKTQIIEPSGKDYIIDTEDLMFEITGNLQPPTSQTSPMLPPTSETSGSGTGSGTGSVVIPDADLDMTDAENEWNYSKSLETTSFIIKNSNRNSRHFKIVIEEVSDYSKFDAISIATRNHEAAYYVRYQATFGNTLIPATRLSDNKELTEDGTNSYVIYEGTLGAKSEMKVNIILYIDYEPLDNSFQNKAFIGTIKLYYIPDIPEENNN